MPAHQIRIALGQAAASLAVLLVYPGGAGAEEPPATSEPIIEITIEGGIEGRVPR